ncbi:hypothetical protein [Crossiella sp. CA198]|uniref:hypothetical protein n=1 Tax=Crossiella sp. CA198 TaxID=3455607 RepID=UPI003F8D0E9D
MTDFYPDGLTPDAINALLAEVWTDLAAEPSPEPTTALLDGSALAQRERRTVQRRLGATVRVLRVHGPVTGRTEAEAA